MLKAETATDLPVAELKKDVAETTAILKNCEARQVKEGTFRDEVSTPIMIDLIAYGSKLRGHNFLTLFHSTRERKLSPTLIPLIL